MWKSIENKQYISWIIIFCFFGLVGLGLVTIIKFISQVSKLYPKIWKWFMIVLFAFIGLYLLLFHQNGKLCFIFIWFAMMDYILHMNNR